uniref:Protein turtle n=1 Tax=Strigamia maritima TaxID=126957 RepID=T1JAP3_STRMM
MEVLVRDPPVITKMPQDMYQRTVNSEVKMPCEATGTPTPKISWRRRDGAKFPHERYSIRGGNLTIKSLRKEDHGYYECVVQNDVATLVVGTLLLVESTTPHAPTNVSVNTSTFEATVSWLPAYDGGFAQHYLVWYRESSRGDNAWRTLRVYPDGASTYTIFSLSPNTEYDFQVLSRNELGDGMFSDIVTATTKPADYTMPVLPTDSSGSTYIPTIVKPSVYFPSVLCLCPSAVTEHRGYSAVPDSSPPAGPKPGTPREVHVRLVTEGVAISWLPPANSTVPVVYYVVEYKTELNSTWLPVAEKVLRGNTYTMKDLIPGKKFFFRVKAATTTHYSNPSQEVDFTLAPPSQEKAITAGIVGGFLFFIVAIILSVCTVKICNKRKRRKQEKVLSLLKSQRQSSDMGEAYNMVACRVADARNGGHGPAGSPVALKNGHSQSRVSGLNFATVKRKLKGLVSLAPHFKPSLEESSRQFGDSQEWGRSEYRPSHRHPQHQQQQALTHVTTGRRFPKAVRYNVQMEYSQPLGWISRTPEGKFVLDEGFVRRDRIPSSQASLQGSSGSRESVLGAWLASRARVPRQRWHEQTPVVQTIYEPRDPRYRVARTSSPGPLACERPFRIDDVSSVQPSSGERSFPSTVSSRLHLHSYELPSLRILHEQLPYIREEVRAEIHREPDDSYYQIPPQPRRVQEQQLRHPFASSPGIRIYSPYVHPSLGPSPVPFRYRFQGDPALHPAPVPRYIHPPPGPRLMHRLPPPGVYYRPPTRPFDQRPLATSSPPQIDRRAVLPSRGVPENEERRSVSSSEDRPVEYTRDRLQETIGRVRSGFVVRAERLPFRQAAPDSGRGHVSYSPATTDTTEEDSTRVTLAVAPNARTSVTSASSGRDSKHSRTDSIRGDVRYSPSSSSGFASRNTSQSQPSPHAAAPSTATRYDVSVDENYEFDSVSPVELARQWRASDSELYANLYPDGKRLRSKYDDVEIERRIPALKEEFQQFRRRQLERRRSEELESEC